MCCRACQGYEVCQAKDKLRDDCCTDCGYFAECMEESTEEDSRPRTNQPSRRYPKGKK